MINRMMRASQLDNHLYEEVERDVDSTGQAALVVIVVAVATGIGALRDGGILGLILGVITALIGWVAWSAVTYWIGKNIFRTANTRVTLGEMLRTIGFAQSPGVLRVLGFIPILGPLVVFIASIWMIITVVIAIRQAMDFSTGRAIATALVGLIPYLILGAITAAVIGT